MHILVAIDFDSDRDVILEQARSLAVAYNASLWLLHVAAPDPVFVGYEVDSQALRDVVAQHYHTEHQQLQLMAAGLREKGIQVTALLVQGSTAETILQQAGKLNAGVIVMGKHNKGVLQRWLLGSVSEAVVRHAAIPVHLVPMH